MKKILSLALLAVLAIAIGCSTGNDEPTPEPTTPTTPTNTTATLEINTASATPTFSSEGGTTQVTITTSSTWTADVASSRASDWCTVSPTSGAAGTATLTITTQPNTTYDERNATITIKSGELTKNYVVTQKQKDAILLSSDKVEMAYIGGSISIEVKANISYSFEIEESAQSWIKTVSSRALTTYKEDFVISTNDTFEKREGKITFIGDGITETVTIYQSAATPTLVLSQNSYSVSDEGETIKVELNTNMDYDVEMPDVDWITEPASRAVSTHTHFFIIHPNSAYDERFAQIKFVSKDGSVSEKVTITQKQKDAILLSSDKIEMAYIGGTASVEVKSNVSYTFEIEESAKSWIKAVTSRALTTHQENFTISANNTFEKREGKITFTGGGKTETVTVYQSAATPTLVLSQNSYNVSDEGETIKVELNTNMDYDVVMPDVDWITEPASRAVSTHTHYYIIRSNSTYDERSAQIRFVSKDGSMSEKVTITQKQKDAILLSSDKVEMSYIGGTANIEVKSNVSYTYEIEESAKSWIRKVTSRALTSHQENFTISANNTFEKREGKITFTGGGKTETVTIYQSAATPTLVLTQNSYSVSDEGETIKVELNTNMDYTVVMPNVDWITEPASRAVSTHTHYYVVRPNSTYDERSAQITFVSKDGSMSEKVTITQKQKDAILLSSDKIEINSEGGTASIEVKSNVFYTYEIDESAKLWIKTVTSRALTSHQENFTISANNTFEKREGKITFTGGGKTETVTIYQSAATPTLVLTQNSYNVSDEGETIKVELNTNMDYTVEMPNVDWITEPASRAVSTHTHYYIVRPNSTYDERAAQITFVIKNCSKKEVVTITQKQKDAILLSSDKIEMSCVGGTTSIEVKSNVSYTYEIEESAKSWIKKVASRALTSHQENFTISTNDTFEKREGKITFTGGGKTETVTVYQSASTPTLVLTQNTYEVSADGETIKVELNTNMDYTVEMPNVDWITEPASRSISTYTHYYIIHPNSTYDERTAQITFVSKNGNLREKIIITQKQKDAILLSSDKVEMTSAGGTASIEVKSNVSYTYEIEESAKSWIKKVASRALTSHQENFTISANNTFEKREGKITFNGGGKTETVTIYQSAATPTLVLTQNSYEVSADGETIKVELNTNMDYMVGMPNVDWITEPASRSISTYTHYYIVHANTTYSERTAHIKFVSKDGSAYEVVTITQKQKDAMQLSTNKIEIGSDGGTASVVVSSNVSYTYEIEQSAQSWIKKVASRALTSNKENFTISANNTFEKREGKITFTGGGKTETVTICQSAATPSLVLTQDTYEVSADGETIKVELSTNTDYTVEMPNVDWITEPASRSYSKYIHYYIVHANTTYGERSAQIRFVSKDGSAHDVALITQKQKDAILLSTDKVEMKSEGGTFSVTVQANVTYDVKKSVDWISQVSSRSLNQKTLTFSVKENASKDSRTGTVTVTNGSISKSITVTQEGTKGSADGGINDMPITDW
jgi:hypothetical protein